jgi:hypothetical protein
MVRSPVGRLLDLNRVTLDLVSRIDYHVQGTKPNADSAFAEYNLCAHTRT